MSEADLLNELRLDRAAREDDGRRWPWRLLVALIVSGLAVGGYFALSNRAVTVELAIAEAPGAGPLTVLDATGYVIARRQATVSSKISGKLAEVLIEEGVQVTAGQVLARLDDTDASAQLDLMQARLSAARSQLSQIQVRLEQARRDLGRQEGLAPRKLTSDESLENARTQVEIQTALLAAQRSQVEVAEAELRIAQVDHDNTVIRAPFTGMVVAKAAQPGEIVSPMSAGGGFTRTGIGTIVDMESLEIEVDVNESFINRVQPGQPVQAILDAYPEWQIPASVIAIIPTADRSKATVKVRIAIDQKDPRLLPEMGVRVSFLAETPTGAEPTAAVLVPASAIVERETGAVVLVLDGERVRERVITPGETRGERRLIEQGLTAGERVVRNPTPDLINGTRVAVRDGTATP